MSKHTKTFLSSVKFPSLGTSANLLDIFSNLLSIGVTIATAYGLMANVGGDTKIIFNINLTELSLTFRLIVFLIAAAALGWGLGAIITRLSAARQDHLKVASYIASLIWGILLVATADWMASVDKETRALAFPLFTLLGMGLMLWLVTFQLRAVSNIASASIVLTQTRSIFLSTVGVMFAFLLNIVSNL